MYLSKEHKDIIGKFQGDEKKLAGNLIERYLKDYSIESVSDLNTLKEVIYYEVIQTRLQDKLNEFAQSKTIPIQLVNVMHQNSDAIIRLKNSLGLFADKEKKTEYDVLKHLKRRFGVWLKENQGSRTLICPHCSKMIMLKIKTDAWEAQKHPWFKDRVLYNEHLFKLYKTQVITKKDLATILETSEDYIDWVLEKVEKVFGSEQVSSEVKVSSSELATPTLEVQEVKEEIKGLPVDKAESDSNETLSGPVA